MQRLIPLRRSKRAKVRDQILHLLGLSLTANGGIAQQNSAPGDRKREARYANPGNSSHPRCDLDKAFERQVIAMG